MGNGKSKVDGDTQEVEEVEEDKPAHLCIVPDCPYPKRIEGNKTHEFCSRTCAQKYHQGQVSPNLKCKTPNCPRKRHPVPGGNSYYDYCSLTCRDNGYIMGPADNETFVGYRVLKADSAERKDICSKFYKDWVKEPQNCPTVDVVLKIVCPMLKGVWEDQCASLAMKGSPTTVEQHYHGTLVSCDIIRSKDLCDSNDCGICGISKNGFQKAYIGSNINFKRFGHGFYLAPHSSKCHDYTRGIHTHRAMLLCDVLPGEKHVIQMDQTHITAPPPGYDSVYGEPGCRLNYPEIVIYDEASILPRYVITYRKDGVEKIAQ